MQLSCTSCGWGSILYMAVTPQKYCMIVELLPGYWRLLRHSFDFGTSIVNIVASASIPDLKQNGSAVLIKVASQYSKFLCVRLLPCPDSVAVP